MRILVNGAWRETRSAELAAVLEELGYDDDAIAALVADGAVALKIAVHAPPVEGRANEALLRFLAQVLRVKRGDLTLVLGASDRRKLVHIAGEPAALMKRLEEELRRWLKPA